MQLSNDLLLSLRSGVSYLFLTVQMLKSTVLVEHMLPQMHNRKFVMAFLVKLLFLYYFRPYAYGCVLCIIIVDFFVNP